MLKIHPVAAILPKLCEADFDALRTSIKRFGQMVPIIVHDGMVLDGRHRYWACNEIGVTPKTIPWEGPTDDSALVNAVVGLNVSRRHLSISQRACVAVKSLERFEAEALKRRQATQFGAVCPIVDTPKGRSTLFASQVFGVGKSYIACAKKVREHREDLFEEVFNGAIGLADAMRAMRTKTAAPSIRIPKLSLPFDATRVLCVWGQPEELERVKHLVAEGGGKYMEADRSEGNKWVTKVSETEPERVA